MASIITILLLLCASLFSSLAPVARGVSDAYGDADLLLRLRRQLTDGQINAITELVNSNLQTLRLKVEASSTLYLDVLFAAFQDTFEATFSAHLYGRNQPLPMLLNDFKLLPSSVAIYHSANFDFRHLKWHFRDFLARRTGGGVGSRPPALPPPDPDQLVDVPPDFAMLFNGQAVAAVPYGQLRTLFLDYVNRYPVANSHRMGNHFLSNVVGRLRRDRLLATYSLLVILPFIMHIVTDGDVQWWRMPDNFGELVIANALFYKVRSEHLFPAHLPIGRFYLAEEVNLVGVNIADEQNFPLHLLPAPPFQGALVQAPVYLVRLQYLYFVQLSAGRYFMIPETALIPVSQELLDAEDSVTEEGQLGTRASTASTTRAPRIRKQQASKKEL